MQSDQINELATALAIAQGEITGARKDSKNPFFNSSYADLASVWDACREALSKNGLAVVQTTDTVIEGQITVVTTLTHKSGQWMRGVLAMSPKDKTPQAFGSCLTYARRYALAAIVGVAQVDDDANAASQPKGDRSGRPDISGVDAEKAAHYALSFSKFLQAGDNEGIYSVQDQLKSEAELYTAVWDKLSSKQRTDLRKIISERTKAA